MESGFKNVGFRSRSHKPVALVPAYQPEGNLIEILTGLSISGGFAAIVLVNDGSDPQKQPTFDASKQIEGVILLEHLKNMGKGAALKTGFNFIGVHFPESIGVVTLDADGQHRVDDVLAVATKLSMTPDSLVLGSREFKGNVPLRSRLGNVVTSKVLRLLGGLSLRDTQTGLRGIPASCFKDLLGLRTNGYDFELDMLLLLNRNGVKTIELPIQTVYLDGNSSSHFNPLIDSLKIYMVFIRFNLSSLLSVIIDYSVFALIYSVGGSVISSQIGARFAAGTVNYFVNYKLVFKSDAPHRKSLLLYGSALVVFAVIAYGLIVVLTETLGISVLIAKILAELTLYIASFAIQREFIFPSARSE